MKVIDSGLSVTFTYMRKINKKKMTSVSRNEIESTWVGVGLRIVMNTVAHPIEYAKVLIQMGHEPVAPYPTKTLFGKPALALPNVFQYVAYIKRVDGFMGCYRGLGPKLMGISISNIAYQAVYDSLKVPDEPEKNPEETDEERRARFRRELKRDMVARSAAIVASQPFTVIAVRMMGQFVGGETKYSGVFAAIGEIYSHDGVWGFFSGVVPRILGELASLIIASSLTFVINAYLVDDEDMKTYVSHSMTFIASAITYPFQVVSNCMAINNSGLVAGMPPQMPIYGSWTNCWSHLSQHNQLKRGSSLIYRYYTGPQLMIQGRPVPLTMKEFAKLS